MKRPLTIELEEYNQLLEEQKMRIKAENQLTDYKITNTIFSYKETFLLKRDPRGYRNDWIHNHIVSNKKYPGKDAFLRELKQDSDKEIEAAEGKVVDAKNHARDLNDRLIKLTGRNWFQRLFSL